MKIPRLKPNSPEFWADGDESAPKGKRICDHPACRAEATHRAPKSRDHSGSRHSSDYFWFCLEHVQDYNRSWDYFKGASPADIERHIYGSMTWDRPTWKMSDMGKMQHERIRERIYRGFRNQGGRVFDEFSEDADYGANAYTPKLPKPETDALKTLGFSGPAPWKNIKARYKELVKKHHPDLNAGDDTAEETIKKINIAYSILKLAHAKLQALSPSYEDQAHYDGDKA